MSRPWFKVATRIKDDPAMIRMDPTAFKVFIFVLGLANERDADGEVCQRDDLAMMLRMPEPVVAAALAEIGPRIKVTKGVVVVRDWLQWQAPSRKPEPPERVAERQRRSRATRSGHANVTQRDSNVSRNGHASLDIEGEKEKEPPNPQGGTAPTFTATVSEAIGQSLGGARITTRGGRPLLWVVDVVKMLDNWTDHDSARAIQTWRSFVDSDAWRYKGAKREDWPAAMGDWYANSANGNGKVIHV